ncbi:MAG: hypothetical protein AAF318_13825 [Pseudomonadota bacterium]
MGTTDVATTLRRLAIILLSGLLLFTLGDRAISALAQSILKESPNRFYAIYGGKQRHDVVLLGNSRADQHFDPATITRLTGLSATNFGLGLVSPTLSEALFKDYVEKNGAPKLVLIEPTFAYNHPRVGQFRALVPHSPRVKAMLDETEPRYGAALTVSHLFALNNDLAMRGVVDLLRGRQGSRIGTGVMTAEMVEAAAKPRQLHVKDSEIAAISRIAAFAQQNGSQVALVMTPLHPVARRATNGLDAFLPSLPQKTGVPLIDLSASEGATHHFSDANHLNRSGVERFTERLIEAGVLGVKASPALASLL